MNGKLLFLGTGGSMGIPMIGCHCAICQSTVLYNKRLRPSALIKTEGKQFLIDAGPDLREQAIRHQIDHIDGALITHGHHDHTAGVDDLRAFYFKRQKPLPILLSQETALDMETRYYYIFKPHQTYAKFMPRLELHLLPQQEGEIEFEGISIRYVTYSQAGMSVNGFCFGHLAYISDINAYPKDLIDHLKGIDTLVVSALRFTRSDFHFSVDEAIDFATKIGAKTTWLTHISHELDHEKTNAYLPSNIKMAYDGLEIDF